MTRLRARVPAAWTASALACAIAAMSHCPALEVPQPGDRAEEHAARQAAAVLAVREACDDAAFLLAAGHPRAAVERLSAALAAAGELPPDIAERAQALLAEVQRAERWQAGRDAAVERQRWQRQGQAERFGEGEQRVALRHARLQRIHDLRRRGHLELALAQARALASDLPGDEEAERLYRALLAEVHARRVQDIAAREQELRRELTLLVERSLIPEGFDGRPIYPGDWQERRAGRRLALEVVDEEPEWRAALRDRLVARVTLNLDAAPLSVAVETLARSGGINIVVAPELLASDSVISLRAVGMPLADALTWIAEQAGTRWSLAEGAVYIGAARGEPSVVVIHDIADLLLGTRDFPGLRLDMGKGEGVGFLAAQEPQPAPTADDIADLIRRAVTPSVWQETGNGIVVRGTALLVTAPPSTQRLIREFLRAQSAQRGLAARIELRWLELSDRLVEEIGVEWSQGPMIVGRSDTPAGVVRRVEGWSLDGSTAHPLPGSALSVQPPLAGTGLTLQAALLNGTRFDAILRAVERSAGGRVLQAPDLVCQNNQRANCFVGDQVAYIGDYEIQGRNYDPVIQVLNLGTTLDVRPTVSADRKYVTLELRSATTEATLFTEYLSVIRVVDSDAATLYLGAQYPLELPNIALRSTATTVMLPDRGSLLVGGFGRALDQFAASRVPLLGSIPFLGRLFGVRGRYHEQRRLYVLATAAIIDYADTEDRL